MKKVCGVCKRKKPITLFFVDKYHKTGYTHQCKLCFKKYQLKTKTKRSAWYANYTANNKKKLAKKAADWYIKNKTEYRKKQNTYYKKYYAANREKLVKKAVKYNKKRYDENPTHRLCHHFSNRLRASVLNKEKNRAFWLVNYTKEQLINHLEKQFKQGMSWDNYGDWHIDHIKPIAAFNFTTYHCSDFRKCWSLKNLQPLWAQENIKKGKKYEQKVK